MFSAAASFFPLHYTVVLYQEKICPNKNYHSILCTLSGVFEAVWGNAVWKMGLTTIISEGSRTMHSHPRRRLPADRFPKLDRKKKTINKMMRKQFRGQHLPNKSCLSSFPIRSVNGTFLFEFWLSHRPRSADRSSSACVSLYVTLGPTFKYAVWTEQHWMDSSSFQLRPLPTEGKHSPLEKSTFMMSQFVQYASLLMRGEPGNIKSSRHQNFSKKGNSHGNSEHEEIQLLGLTKNAAFVQHPNSTQRHKDFLVCYF